MSPGEKLFDFDEVPLPPLHIPTYPADQDARPYLEQALIPAQAPPYSNPRPTLVQNLKLKIADGKTRSLMRALDPVRQKPGLNFPTPETSRPDLSPYDLLYSWPTINFLVEVAGRDPGLAVAVLRALWSTPLPQSAYWMLLHLESALLGTLTRNKHRSDPTQFQSEAQTLFDLPDPLQRASESNVFRLHRQTRPGLEYDPDEVLIDQANQVSKQLQALGQPVPRHPLPRLELSYAQRRHYLAQSIALIDRTAKNFERPERTFEQDLRQEYAEPHLKLLDPKLTRQEFTRQLLQRTHPYTDVFLPLAVHLQLELTEMALALQARRASTIVLLQLRALKESGNLLPKRTEGLPLVPKISTSEPTPTIEKGYIRAPSGNWKTDLITLI